MLLLVAALAWLGAGAYTLDQVTEAYYADDPALQEMLGDFIQSADDVRDLDEALRIWKDTDALACRDFINAMQLQHPEDPRYPYLGIIVEDDPEIRVHKSRALLEDHPESLLGYNALLWSYVGSYPFAYNTDDAERMESLLAEDLPLLAEYYERFPGEENSLLAIIFHEVQLGDVEAALLYLRAAVDNGAEWLNRFYFPELFPVETCHLLYRTYLTLLLAEDHADTEKINSLGDYLMSYYFDDLQDYAGVISFFGTDSQLYESYYISYALILSYYRTGDYDGAFDLLIQNGDLEKAVSLLETWRYFSTGSEEATSEMQAVYLDVLPTRPDEPVGQYLFIQMLPSLTDKLAYARLLVERHPGFIHSYEALADVYFNAYADARAEAEARQSLTQGLRQDARLIRKFYYRDFESQKALRAYLLLSVVEDRDERALNLFNVLRRNGMDYDTYLGLDVIVVGAGKLDLLWKIKQADVDRTVEEDFLHPDRAAEYVAIGYCAALYNSGRYDLLVAELERKPEWKQIEAIQDPITNAYYFTGDYDRTIDMLYQMVDQERLDAVGLEALKDLDIASHPRWQALLDYAASKTPASTDSGEAEETSGDWYDEFGPEDYYEDDIYAIEEVDDSDFDPNDPEDIGNLLLPDDEEPLAEDEAYRNLIGKSAPDWTLKDIEGNEVTLSELKGNLVLLDFWASWCAPCQQAMIQLDIWTREHKPEGMRVFSINVWEDNPAEGASYFAEKGYAMEFLAGTDEVAEAYAFPGIPFLCLVNAEGIVTDVQLGYQDTLIDDLDVWLWFAE
jgi:thiol-disulfide isomerase/thioredoxin